MTTTVTEMNEKNDKPGDVLFRDYETVLGQCRHALVVAPDGARITVNALHASAAAKAGYAGLDEWQAAEQRRLLALTLSQRLDMALRFRSMRRSA